MVFDLCVDRVGKSLEVFLGAGTKFCTKTLIHRLTVNQVLLGDVGENTWMGFCGAVLDSFES